MDEFPKNNFLEKKSEKANKEVFKKYMKSLDLKPEDFDKKILDIGAGRTDFAKWAKDHNVSSEIYSIDPHQKPKEKEKSARTFADKLPFQDNVFDLVVSCAAFPNVLFEEYGTKIKENFLEILRVVKPGGEIRLGRALKWKKSDNKRKQELTEGVDLTLAELKMNNVGVEEIRQPFADLYDYDKKHRPTRLLAEAYLIKLHKLK